MRSIILDNNLCIRCGRCSAVCPSHLIEQNSMQDYPTLVDRAGEVCIACNHCVSLCPGAAISVDGVDVRQCESLTKDMLPRFDHVAALIRSRRSIRRYNGEDLENSVVEQLLNVARWAPSARNGLPVQWIVVNKREKVRELAGLVVRWMESVPALKPLIEVWNTGGDPIFRGAPCVVVAYTNQQAMWPEVDTTIAVETLDLCASAMRLGACWAGYFIRAAQNDPTIKVWLGLKEDETVYGGLMLGKIGDEVYQKIPPRPPISLRWI